MSRWKEFQDKNYSDETSSCSILGIRYVFCFTMGVPWKDPVWLKLSVQRFSLIYTMEGMSAENNSHFWEESFFRRVHLIWKKKRIVMQVPHKMNWNTDVAQNILEYRCRTKSIQIQMWHKKSWESDGAQNALGYRCRVCIK